MRIASLKPAYPWMAMAAMLLFVAAVLRWLGRLWISDSGWLLLWTGAWTPETSQQLLDPYSLTHALHGILFWWLAVLLVPKLPFAWQLCLAIAVESAWEVLENTPYVIERYREGTAALGYEGDTLLNVIGDILACAAGFVVARRLGWRWSLGLFFAVEFILLLWIRDNLLLNVLMLLYPIEAIKQWQTP
jgi:hypothetical protein